MPVETLGVVLDGQGVVQTPNRPYALIDQHMQAVRPGWRTVEEMVASIKRSAPEPRGLPPGSPNPNDVYLKDDQHVRYVVDTSEPTQRHVSNGTVRERVKFVPRMVSLTLEGARAATNNGTRCDFWNGFTWIRNGYVPERDFPTMMKVAERGGVGEELVFEQDVSPTDEAVIRHQIAHLERTRPTLPVKVGDVDGNIVAAQSVPFPLADEAAAAAADATRRGSGRPRKDVTSDGE